MQQTFTAWSSFLKHAYNSLGKFMTNTYHCLSIWSRDISSRICNVESSRQINYTLIFHQCILFILFYAVIRQKENSNITLLMHTACADSIHELYMCSMCCYSRIKAQPESKVHGANMGPTWGRKDPGGPQVGPMNIAIWEGLSSG